MLSSRAIEVPATEKHQVPEQMYTLHCIEHGCLRLVWDKFKRFVKQPVINGSHVDGQIECGTWPIFSVNGEVYLYIVDILVEFYAAMRYHLPNVILNRENSNRPRHETWGTPVSFLVVVGDWWSIPDFDKTWSAIKVWLEPAECCTADMPNVWFQTSWQEPSGW